MKKICICTTVSLTQKCFVLPTAEYLLKNCGYDVTLVCAYDSEFAKIIPEGIKYKPIEMARGIDIKGIKSVKELKKFFLQEKFDMVQYSTPNASFYASIAAKKAKIPVRLYCQWGIRYTGMSGIMRKVFKFIEKLTCRLSTDIRSVSQMNRQFGIDEGLYPEDKVSVVGNGGTIGVDLDDYDIKNKNEWFCNTRKELGIAENDFVFGFCGRVSKDKGCEELIRAFMSLKSDDTKLVIIGKADDNCDIDYELLKYLKTSPDVKYTGWVENSRMKRYYAALDVLVHPTYREGFGMVIQEAGALGIPCITTKIIGASEVMEDNVSSILVQPKNSDELYNAMKRLYGDRELTKQIGTAAYTRTKALYERGIMLRNQLKDYVSLLGE